MLQFDQNKKQPNIKFKYEISSLKDYYYSFLSKNYLKLQRDMLRKTILTHLVVGMLTIRSKKASRKRHCWLPSTLRTCDNEIYGVIFISIMEFNICF